MKKVIVSLSGGMDSTTVLALAQSSGCEEVVRACAFRYGSKHEKEETEAASRVAEHYKVRLSKVRIHGAFQFMKSGLLRSGGELPEGHYEAESMRQTVVPGRNMIFISVLAGIAESVGAEQIWLGVHAGDHHIYPDCRPEFIQPMSQAVYNATDGKVIIWTPFLHQTKAEILRWGLDNKVPYELTRTCYSSNAIACGKCGSCQERLESFKLMKREDPLEYASRTLLPK